MFKFQLFEPASFHNMRWRNGQGTTLELLKHCAADSDEFNWRLSIASVVQNGEFSCFAGYDRTLILLEGNGVTLDVREGEGEGEGEQFNLSRQLQQASFKGEDKTIATLHNGEINDFNVMIKRTFGSASIVSQGSTDARVLQQQYGTLLVYAIDNDLAINCQNGDSINVPAGHLFQTSDCRSESLTLSGAPFISVAIMKHR